MSPTLALYAEHENLAHRVGAKVYPLVKANGADLEDCQQEAVLVLLTLKDNKKFVALSVVDQARYFTTVARRHIISAYRRVGSRAFDTAAILESLVSDSLSDILSVDLLDLQKRAEAFDKDVGLYVQIRILDGYSMTVAAELCGWTEWEAREIRGKAQAWLFGQLEGGRSV